MKYLPTLLAALCVFAAAASPSPAQNATPEPAAAAANPIASPPPGFIRFQVGPAGDPHADIPYHEGMTLSELIKNLPKELKSRADTTSVRWYHAGDSGTVIDCTAIANGQAKDIPLSLGDLISTRFKPFTFPGGSPRDLVQAVQDYFGVDWSMAVISPKMAQVQIPHFGILGGADVNEVVDLYNELGTRIPSLGQWYSRGPLNAPEILMLMPDQSEAAAVAITPAAKAIGIADIPKEKWDQIQQSIRQADIASQAFAQANNFHLSGVLLIQDDSKILIVIGPPVFIEFAESVVAAYRENEKNRPGPSVGIYVDAQGRPVNPPNPAETAPPPAPPLNPAPPK
jgi:hypothetical protein